MVRYFFGFCRIAVTRLLEFCIISSAWLYNAGFLSSWPMLPWPTDYNTAPDSKGDWLFVADNLGMADYAVHEWIGMLAYRLTGKAQ